MRKILKAFFNLISQIIVLPFAISCKAEEWFVSRHSETIFHICTNIIALLPGMPGVFLRRAFYSLTITHCSINCHIGFGSLISHRDVTIGDSVYIGNYSMFGSCILSDHCLIGSRVSVLSGKSVHTIDEKGMWSPFSPEKMVQIRLGTNVWAGEGAIIMADVGDGCVVGAGAVVTSLIQPHSVVAGNPARIIRSLKDVDN